jgi:hypothetical protein
VGERHDGGDVAHRHPAVVGDANRLVAILSQFLRVLIELRVPPRVVGRERFERSKGLRSCALRPGDGLIVGVILAN